MVRRIPRWLVRAPISVYRHGLGWVFGRRLAMVEHTGRKSGRPRWVVLEVVAREPGGFFVVSGYGHASQWLRNVQASPAVRVWTGRETAVPATAVLLDATDSRRRLEWYRHRYRLSAKALGRVLDIPELSQPGPLPLDAGQRLPLVWLSLAH